MTPSWPYTVTAETCLQVVANVASKKSEGFSIEKVGAESDRREDEAEEQDARPSVTELRTHHQHASVQSAIFGTTSVQSRMTGYIWQRRALRTNVLVSDYMRSGTRGLDLFTLEHEIHIDVR